MKTCMRCKYAEWKKTAAGKLHPSGDGRCLYVYRIPPVPACMYWIGGGDPVPCGGFINCRNQHKDHCPYWGEQKREGEKA